MKTFLTACALTIGAVMPSFAADLITVNSSKSVGDTMDALEQAVTGAGATIFARVDHARGAATVDMQLDDAQTLIFGNPKLGTPAMQADLRASLYLPLKVAVYARDGGSVLTYEDPAAMFSGLDISSDAKFVAMMTGALGKLTAKAAE